MRPSVQLASVSGVHRKLGLTVVRPSMQSAPEPPVLDPPPVSIMYARYVAIFLKFLTSSGLNF